MPETTESRKEKIEHAEYGAEEAKKIFGDLIARAGFGAERIVITRFGKEIAALIPISDLEVLDGAA